VNAAGLMLAVHFDSAELNRKVIHGLLERGVFTDWFLFAPQALRIAPPLSITTEELRKACSQICEVLDTL
jgi:4-aminobutyrate aminotransferase-like enzyme